MDKGAFYTRLSSQNSLRTRMWGLEIYGAKVDFECVSNTVVTVIICPGVTPGHAKVIREINNGISKETIDLCIAEEDLVTYRRMLQRKSATRTLNESTSCVQLQLVQLQLLQFGLT